MNTIKGITIELDANTQPFKKALEEVRKDIAAIAEETKPKGVYIFKCNRMLTDNDYDRLKNEIAKQIESGVVVLKSGVEFVEFIGEDEGEELFVVHAG